MSLSDAVDSVMVGRPASLPDRLARHVRRSLGPVLSAWAGVRGRLGLQRRLMARVAAIETHISALRTHGDAVEQAFVTVGSALTEQRRLAAELLESGEGLAPLTASSVNENPVRAAIVFISARLDELDTFQRQTTQLIDRLATQYDAIAQVRSGGEQLERAIAPLRIVDTLFRIESAGLPVETRSAFAALTHDISELDTKVRETFLRHFEALGTTREAIRQVLDHFAAQRAKQERVASDEREAVRAALQTLDRDISQLRDGAEQTASIVGRIDRDACAMVVGLQFQDITRQKLEHVVTAIGSLRRRITDSPDAATVAVVEQTSQLEATQLRAINADLAQAVATVEQGLRNVISSLHEIEQGGLSAARSGVTAEQLDAMFDRLAGILEVLGDPMRRVTRNAEAAVAAVHSFGGLTADLGATIRELTWGIRLIALNAQVQAAQVQRCDGLEVLARHTYLVSEETSRCADVIGRDLGEVATRLAEIVALAETFAAEAAAACGRFDTESGAIGRRLQEQRATVVDALRQFPSLVRETRAFAAELLDDVAIAQVDRTPLLRAASDLEALAAELTASASNRSRQDARAEIAAVRASYTMASERAVHDAVLAGVPVDDAVDAPQPKQPGSDTPFGGNVELF